MEVTVLDASGLPPDTVLSVRMGPAQQHAQLEVNQPMTLPHPGPEHTAVEVGLLRPLASEVLPGDCVPEAFCSIPVRRSDGSDAQVKLRVRRRSSGGSPPCGGAYPANGKARAPDPAEEKQDRLYEWINGLVQDVLHEKPRDPCRFLLERLRKSREASDGFSEGSTRTPPSSSGLSARDREPPPQQLREAAAPPLRPPDRPHPARASGRQQPTRAVHPAGQQAPAPAQRAPASESHAQARYSLSLVLRSPACLEVAEQSLREKVQRDAAQRLAGLALGVARERFTARSATGNMTPSRRQSAVGLGSRPPSAARIMKDRSELQARRDSLPTPLVSLGTEKNSWGQWLRG